MRLPFSQCFRIHFSFVVFSFLVFLPGFASASGVLSVNPSVLDAKASPRDIIKKEISLTNPTTRLLSLYTTVTDIENGVRPENTSGIDSSLASWIEISRGVIELGPGETRKIPMLVQVNLKAKPGMYHSVISFREGATRMDAETTLNMDSSVGVNIEVLSDAKERLQLSTFIPEHHFFGGNEAKLKFELENIGNTSLRPRGQVRIFNGSGVEVAALDANASNILIDPDKKIALASVWQSQGSFGKYKALLDLEYGETQRGSIQDTVFFWVVPWKRIAGTFTALGAMVVVGAMLFHTRYLARRPEYSYAPIATNMPEDDEDEVFIEPPTQEEYTEVPRLRPVGEPFQKSLGVRNEAVSLRKPNTLESEVRHATVLTQNSQNSGSVVRLSAKTTVQSKGNVVDLKKSL